VWAAWFDCDGLSYRILFRAVLGLWAKGIVEVLLRSMINDLISKGPVISDWEHFHTCRSGPISETRRSERRETRLLKACRAHPKGTRQPIVLPQRRCTTDTNRVLPHLVGTEFNSSSAIPGSFIRTPWRRMDSMEIPIERQLSTRPVRGDISGTVPILLHRRQAGNWYVPYLR
jgi:hypothetical protein